MYKITVFFIKLFFSLIIFQEVVASGNEKVHITKVPFEGARSGYHNNSFDFTASWDSDYKPNSKRENSLLWIFGDGTFGFSTLEEPITHTYHQQITTPPFHNPYVLVNIIKDDDENPFAIPFTNSNQTSLSYFAGNLTLDQFNSDRTNPRVKMNGALRLIANRNPKPGDDVTYVITYKNTCNSLTSGTIVFEFDRTIFEQSYEADYTHFYHGEDCSSFNNCQVSISSVSNNYFLKWTFAPPSNPMPIGEQRNIIVTLKTKENARIEQELESNVRFDELLGGIEFFCSDTNFVSLKQTVVNSHDPNFKIVLNEDPLCRSQGYNNELQEYYIEFQNNGGGAADSVTVIDQLHPFLDWNSIVFNPTDSNHAKFFHGSTPSVTCTLERNGNRLQWIFKGDNFLRGMREPGYGIDFHPDDTKGWIKFYARPVQMPLCGAIPNRAEIIFDCNPSIFTTTSLNKIDCWNCLNSCLEKEDTLKTDTINQGQTASVDLAEITPILSNPDFTYEWYPSEFVANPNQPNTTFTPNVTTDYILIAYDGSTLCQRYLFHKKVVVRPCIELEVGVQQICDEGDTGIIEATIKNNGGTSPYIWSTCETANSISMTQLEAGRYHIYVKDAKGCSADTLIHINAPLPLWVDLEQNGSRVETLVSGGFPSYMIYHWSTGETTKTISTNLPETYFVTVTDSKYCTATQSIAISAKKMDVVGIEGELSQSISPLTLYPNPTSQMVRLGFAVAQNGLYQLEVVDVYGQVHQTQYLPLQKGHHTQKIDLTDVKEGVYWVTLYHQGFKQSEKIVVMY